jgi:hypothetical protein
MDIRVEAWGDGQHVVHRSRGVPVLGIRLVRTSLVHHSQVEHRGVAAWVGNDESVVRLDSEGHPEAIGLAFKVLPQLRPLADPVKGDERAVGRSARLDQHCRLARDLGDEAGLQPPGVSLGLLQQAAGR